MARLKVLGHEYDDYFQKIIKHCNLNHEIAAQLIFQTELTCFPLTLTLLVEVAELSILYTDSPKCPKMLKKVSKMAKGSFKTCPSFNCFGSDQKQLFHSLNHVQCPSFGPIPYLKKVNK